MPIRIFEAACAVIVVATLVAMARRAPWRALLADYGLLACAGWVGEQACISLYRHYEYDLAWDARLVDVPILVPLIWPLVILSARDVASGLFPRASGLGRAAIVGAIVVFDASLVEVVAVRAGLWSWAEGGHLGVPVIGILGWGYFAFGADLVLTRAKTAWHHALVVPLAPAIGHALIVASWWLGLKWLARGDQGVASLVALVAASLAITFAVARARARGHAIPFEVAWPRVFAAGLFFVLLLSVAPTDVPLWLHVACVAIPYVTATRWPARRGVVIAGLVCALAACAGAASSDTSAQAVPAADPAPAAVQPTVRREGTPDDPRYVHRVGDQEIAFATRAERERTGEILAEVARVRTAEGMPTAPELTRAEQRALDAQLPWAEPYRRTCAQLERATSERARWAAARSGQRIARGTPAGHDELLADPVWIIDEAHPGHPLVRAQARLRLHITPSYPSASLELGSHALTTFPDGGAPELPPEHPLIQAAQSMRDGACVLVTGHVLGGYTTGHLDYDLHNLACGRAFWARIDEIVPCDHSTR